MKNISTKTKIISSIITIVIIVGLAITFTIGLNFDLKYQEAQKIQLLLGKEFEISDIKQITDEVFSEGQEVIIQKAREFEDVLNLTAKEITEEQKTNLITKLNEKYGLELTNESAEVVTVPHTRLRDMLKPYIMPFAIVSIIILIYFVARYYKLDKLKTVLIYISSIIISQLALLSVMAITRIPIGRLTIPLILIVYVLTLLGLTNYFEKKLDKKTSEEK